MDTDCSAARSQVAAQQDTYKRDAIMATEVVLPVLVHFTIFVCIWLRISKLRRASLYYNRQTSKVAKYKQWGLIAWAILQLGMAGLVYVPHFKFAGECFDLAVYLEKDLNKLAVCLAGVFQVICILLCWYLIGFEVTCKVNPLWTYTRGNFIACIFVYLVAVIGLAVVDKESPSTGLFMYLLYMLRMMVVIFLAIYHELHSVNFHTFNDERARISSGGGNQIHNMNQGKSVLKKSRGEFGIMSFRLKVLDQVKRHGDTDKYVVEVYSQARKVSTVEKTYNMFRELERDLCNFLRDSESNLPTLEKGIVYAGGSESSPGDKYMRSPDKHTTPQEELKNIKDYCKLLTGNPDFQDGPFFDFFKIPQIDAVLPEVDGRSSLHSGDKSRDDSQNMVAHQSGLGWRMFVDEDSDDFTLYFRVTSYGSSKSEQGHYVYRFRVSLIVQTISDEDVVVILDKRYSDFDKLEKQMSKKICPPPLPKKTIVQTEKNAADRLRALSEWLNEVTNSKLYHSSDLFDFIDLKRFARETLNRSLYVREMRSVKTSMVSHKSVNTSTENFIVYIIKADVLDTRSQDKAGERIVERRFRDFVFLHNHLKAVFKKDEKKTLPELPSRWTSFSSADQRMQKLNKYMASLCEYPFILEIMFFRKFIGMSSDLLQNLGSTQIQMLH